MKKSIPLVDLKAQYASIEKEVDEAVKRVLRSGQYILGSEVEALEQEVAEFCGCKYGVGVASGTDALILALKAIGIGPGDEVITSPLTFVASASSIVHCGAKPVFVDIDPETFNLNTDLIERAITEKTRAIIPVHLYGQPADMDKILELARKYRLFVVEDVAQAIGAKYKGKAVGQFGHAGCISFFPSKNLGAFGDGGLVVTNDPEISDRIKMLRAHGSKPRYYYHMIGYNSRLDTIQAAILRAKLPYLNAWAGARQRLSALYNELLREINYVKTPYIAPDCSHVFHQYTIRVLGEKRDALRNYLRERGIETQVYYPLPLHLQPCFGFLGYEEGDFPESEKASREVLSLPMFPELTEEQQKCVAGEITRFFEMSEGESGEAH
ncbi:MAG: DegT/DnrJ/EryC1/StrS family aminotransferase [Candidatus Saccharicenans sp.]|nr:DegT/DnrJ/EryC1/StrS family aminotransferase [Candidatus Saccharicenans sp.]